MCIATIRVVIPPFPFGWAARSRSSQARVLSENVPFALSTIAKWASLWVNDQEDPGRPNLSANFSGVPPP